MDSTVLQVFQSCVKAIKKKQFIKRENKQDKEFHFQNWIKERLAETALNFELGGRNSYPDFRIVKCTEGYEVKGLAYPGREANYDCNSQVPSGKHNGRTIFYIFGRYPSQPDDNNYPVLDLVICHGDFLNVDHEYVHKNKSIKGFGSYGDVMIRDRKMYVAPTPFGLVNNAAHRNTLILPENFPVTKEFKKVGVLSRKEAPSIIIGYTFNLRTNVLVPETVPNKNANSEHRFNAWRLVDDSDDPVTMKEIFPKKVEAQDEDESEE